MGLVRIAPENMDLTAGWAVGQIDQFEQATLACARRAGEEMKATRLKVETYIA